MKVIAKLFGTLIKAVLALLILALLTPILYFAWRANQPMDMPEFKGLTLVQYEDWRKMIYEKNEDEFALAHPDRIVKQGVCFKADLTIQAVGVTLVSGSLFGSLLLPKNRERTVSMIDRLGLATVAWNMIEGTLAVMPVGRNNLLPPRLAVVQHYPSSHPDPGAVRGHEAGARQHDPVGRPMRYDIKNLFQAEGVFCSQSARSRWRLTNPAQRD